MAYSNNSNMSLLEVLRYSRDNHYSRLMIDGKMPQINIIRNAICNLT